MSATPGALGKRGSSQSGSFSVYTRLDLSFNLSKLIDEPYTLPKTVQIQSGVVYGPTSLQTDSHLAVLGTQIVKVVEFEDLSGRTFREPVLLNVCRFRLRSPKVNDKKYDSVRDVLDQKLPDGTLIQARTGFAVDHDEELNVEPGDVFEVNNDVLALEDLECVSWRKRHGASQDLRQVNGIKKGRSLSVISRCSMTSPIIIPLDTDCMFCEPYDPECYLLEELVDMQRNGIIELPVRVEVAPPEDESLDEIPLVASLMQSQFNLNSFVDMPFLVASDGDDVLFLPKPLCEKVPVLEIMTNAGRKAANMFNKQCSKNGGVKSLWYPEKGSFSAMFHLSTAV